MKFPNLRTDHDGLATAFSRGRRAHDRRMAMNPSDLKTVLKRVRASGDHLRRFSDEFTSAGHLRSPVETVRWSVRDHPMVSVVVAASVGAVAARLLLPR